MSVPVAVASLAWACGPSGYGVPETPAAPPPSTALPAAPPSTVTGPPAATGPQAPAPPVGVEIGSATAKSVAREPSGAQSPQAPSQRVAAGRPAPSLAGQADITARVGGSTAGVVEQRGQSVFASSAAPRASKADRGKKSAARPSAKSTPPAVSQRSATGDLWSGVTSGGASLASAASAGETDGLSGGIVAAIAILGLGLAGIAGGALATAGRRRRATAGAAKRQ